MEVRERTFQDEQIALIAQNSERLCARLTEDAMGQIDELRLRIAGSKFPSKYESMGTSEQLNTEQSQVVAAKMAESVEELA